MALTAATRIPTRAETRPSGAVRHSKARHLPLRRLLSRAMAPVLCASMLAGCAPTTGGTSALVSSTTPKRVVMQIINNSCNEKGAVESESLTTASVKGLTKVLNGFGIPYDEHADNFSVDPVPITDDSYEANKERGIGYMGIEAHMPQQLASDQAHSPDHPEQPTEPGTTFSNLMTLEEKYGIAMRWENWKPDQSGPALDGYLSFLGAGKREGKQYVAVHNLVTDKWCICCPYDWGPRLNHTTVAGGKYAGGRIGGVTAQAAEDLGISGGDGPADAMCECWWVENSEQVQCGPVNDLSALTGGTAVQRSAADQSVTVASGIVTGTTASVVTLAAAATSEVLSPQITQHEDHGFRYWLYEARPGKKGQPLILSLHGKGKIGNDLNDLRGQSSLSAWILNGTLTPDCNVVMPQTPTYGWEPEAVKELLDGVVKDTGSDTSRLSITGVSMGGFGVWDMLVTYPRLFATASPVASSGLNLAKGDLSKVRTKVRSLVGSADTYNDLNAVNEVKRGGGTAEQIVVPGADHSTMCAIYGNEQYNPVPFLLSGTSSRAGATAYDGVRVEPANPNSFVNKVSDAFQHGDLPADRVSYIVLHDTEAGTDNASAIVNAWAQQGDGAATHFVVDKSGRIYQCADIGKVAWHAGSAGDGANERFALSPVPDNPSGRGIDGDNLMSWHSVGIALVHERDDGAYPETQLNALDRLVAYIDQELGHDTEIIDHKEWANQDGKTRKRDCSGKFPLRDYKKSRNHNGVTTEEEAEEASCDEAGKDSSGQTSSMRLAIAKKAVEIAGSATPDPPIRGGHDEKPTDSRLATYVSEKTRIWPDDTVWAACSRAVGTAVKASGADEDWPCKYSGQCHAYLEDSDKWELVGTWRTGDSADILQPGDVLSSTQNHIKLFVGNEIVRTKFPSSTGNMLQASAGDFYPWIYKEDFATDSRDFDIFRLRESRAVSASAAAPLSGTWDDLWYSQTDPQWADERYQYGSIGGEGCGLCATAHAASILLGQQLTPPQLAAKMRDVASPRGWTFNPENTGTVWAPWESTVSELFRNDLSLEHIPSTVSSVKSALQSGKMVIYSVPRGYSGIKMADGSYRTTPGGHVMMTYKYENGSFYVKGSAEGAGGLPAGHIQYDEGEFARSLAVCAGHLGFCYALSRKDGQAPGTSSASSEATSSNGGGGKFSTTDFSDTYVIGDSVLVWSSGHGHIKEYLPGAGFDTECGRNFESDAHGDTNDGMIDIARRVAGQYKRYVIEGGINDGNLTEEMTQEFVSVLGGPGVQIYFVAHRLVRPSTGRDDKTREAIEAAISTNKNVYMIDWNSLVTGHEGEWLADDCHPNDTGSVKLVTLIRDTLIEHAGDGGSVSDGEGGVNVSVSVTRA